MPPGGLTEALEDDDPIVEEDGARVVRAKVVSRTDVVVAKGVVVTTGGGGEALVGAGLLGPGILYFWVPGFTSFLVIKEFE